MDNNSKKTLWYLHPYAGGPKIGPAFRPYYFCKEFSKNNIVPVIISSSWHHLMYDKGKPLENKVVDGINYIFLKTNSYYSNGFNRICNMFGYTIKLLFNKKLKDNYRPHIIIVSSPHLFTFISAYILSKRYNAKLILEIRDIWPLSLIDIVGVSSKHPFISLLSIIEKFAYRRSHYIVTLFNNGKRYFQNFGVKEDSIVYIPNGSVLKSNIQNIDDDEIINYIKARKDNGDFIIGYTGAHGTPNALKQLLESIVILKASHIDKFHVIMVGDGIEKETLIEFSNKNNLKNITFFDSVDKSRIEPIIKEFDLCYIASLKKNIYQYGVSPNKLFEYMRARRTILSSIYLDTIVENAECGIVANCENPEHLALKIKYFLNMERSKLEKMGNSGFEYLLKNHDIKKLAKNYMQLF